MLKYIYELKGLKIRFKKSVEPCYQPAKLDIIIDTTKNKLVFFNKF